MENSALAKRVIGIKEEHVGFRNTKVLALIIWLLRNGLDLPGGTVVKNPPAIARDTGSSPGLGRSHMPRSN